MLVIMAAGQGSRMNLGEGINKCSMILPGINMTSIDRLISQFDQKINILVVGYGSQSIIDNLKESTLESITRIIYNPYYDKYGSGYSLSCALDSISYYIKNDDDPIFFVEGDSVYSDDVVSEFKYDSSRLSSSEEGSVLVRNPSYLSDSSVLVISNNTDHVLSFVYDPSHTIDFSAYGMISNTDGINFYDSMQLWSIGRDARSEFIKNIVPTNHLINIGNPNKTNLYPFIRYNNMSINYFYDDPNKTNWVNLNTREDINKVKEVI